MSDPKAERVASSVDQVATAGERLLPREIQAITSQLGNIEQAKLNAAQQVSPGYNQLAVDLAQKYLPQLQQATSDAAVGADVAASRKYGTELAQLNKQYEQQSDPTSYANKQLASQKLGELLTSINLNDANPEAQRLVSQENIRSGNNTNPSATNTVANALSFGDQMQKRRNALGNALSVATNYINSSRSQFNPLSITAGRGNASNYVGVNRAGSEGFDLGQNAFGMAAQQKQQANQINANRESVLDKMNQITQATGSVVSV